MFKGIVVLALIAAIAFAAWRLHASIYKSGYEAGQRDYEEAQEDRTVEVIREVEKIVKEVEIVYVDRVKEIKVRGEQVIVKVPVYITKEDDRACELRTGFVRIHDSAARNDPPGAAAESDRDPAGITLAEATAIFSENYTRYHACRAQVIGWNEFWSKYRATLSNAVCLPKEQQQ